MLKVSYSQLCTTPTTFNLYHAQIETVYGGEQARFVVLVGEDNYYRDYEVAVKAVNDMGEGPLSPVVTIKSAMGRKCPFFINNH